MSDGKYFSNNSKRGELFELQNALNSTKKTEKRDAVKKVIAAMTIGKDVSSLFNDVVKCMQEDNLELKKLVYLYLMNYAKSSPEDAILAVNSFVKDCLDPNPLIRALAVRTMGCIRVHRITEYLCDPLRKTLKDDDPYVRKTAAVCVAKLYDIDAQLVEEQGFVDMLRELLSDANPMVVANAVAALSEIHDTSPSAGYFDMNPGTVSKLLTALNECTEWGQIFILDSLAIYAPEDQRELQSICERVAPRLQHVNAAVVLSAVKVILKLVEGIVDPEYKDQLLKKISAPLVTLLSSEPEVQYVALRNINLVAQKYQTYLSEHMKVFFVKYNDPIYVKLEKLDIIIRLASDSNIQQVLAELKEYATEVDVDFVRKSVRAIGRCAIKVQGSAQRCVDTLLDLIQTKVNYVVQEAVVVIKDIFRKYPNQYESIIANLCENLDSLDEPEAKAAMVWIVGEYCDRIDNADELLESFVDTFDDEDVQVQLQLLTATVKLFLKRPKGNQELVQKVLGLCTQESDDPDLRDRGFIYWRLLMTDPEAAKAVVLGEKPLISEETDLLEPSLLEELFCHISSLAAVYHKPPSSFVTGHAASRRPLAGSNEKEADIQLVGSAASNSVDLLGDQLADTSLASTGPEARGLVKPVAVWLEAASGESGLEITGTCARKGGALHLDMTVANKSSGQLSDLAIMFNKNSFKLKNAAPLEVAVLSPGASQRVSLEMAIHDDQIGKCDPLNKVDVAIKSSAGVSYFHVLVPYHTLLSEDGKLERANYLDVWKRIPQEENQSLSGVSGTTNKDIIDRLENNNVFHIATLNRNDKHICYYSMKFINGIIVLVEITLEGNDKATACYKSDKPVIITCARELIGDVLGASKPANDLLDLF